MSEEITIDLGDGRKVVDGALVLPEMPDMGSGPPTHGFPTDWAWGLQDGKRAYLSALIAVVDKTDPAFKAWSADGRVPSQFPMDEAGVDSFDELQKELDKWGLHATLAHYVGAARYATEIRGITVQIGGAAVPMATDRASRDGARDTFIAILSGLRQDGAAFKFADGISRPATNDEMKAACAAAFKHVQDAYDLEPEVLKAVLAGTIKTPAAVDAAFA